MKPLLFGLTCLATSLVPLSLEPHNHPLLRQVTVAERPGDIQRATVLVQSAGDFGRSMGTGLLVKAQDGVWYAWTVAHVITANRPGISSHEVDIRLTLRTGDVIPATLVAIDTFRDIALLRLDHRDIDAESVAFMAGRGTPVDIQAGTSITCVGNFEGDVLPWSVTRGNVAYVGRELEDRVWTQTTCPVWFGFSGAGVFTFSATEGYRCIGLVSCGWEECFTLIIPYWVLGEFARQHNVTGALGGSGEVNPTPSEYGAPMPWQVGQVIRGARVFVVPPSREW